MTIRGPIRARYGTRYQRNITISRGTVPGAVRIRRPGFGSTSSRHRQEGGANFGSVLSLPRTICGSYGFSA